MSAFRTPVDFHRGIIMRSIRTQITTKGEMNMDYVRILMNKSTGFSFWHGWLMSNYTGEIVRPWNLPHIIRMLREIKGFLKTEEQEVYYGLH